MENNKDAKDDKQQNINTNEDQLENDSEWNLVDNQLEVEVEVEDKTSIPFGNISQSIIVGTLNNRLNEISLKMDTIIEKIDNLESRLNIIEELNLNKSEYDPVIFNNPDIGNILKIDDNEIQEIKSRLESTTINSIKSDPIPVMSRPTSFSPITYDSRYMGLKYISNNNIAYKPQKPPFMIPFSSPY